MDTGVCLLANLQLAVLSPCQVSFSPQLKERLLSFRTSGLQSCSSGHPLVMARSKLKNRPREVPGRFSGLLKVREDTIAYTEVGWGDRFPDFSGWMLNSEAEASLSFGLITSAFSIP